MLAEYVGQGYAVKIFVYHAIKSLPDSSCRIAFGTAAFARRIGRANHGSERILDQKKYTADGVILRILSETVTASLSSDTLKEARSCKYDENALEILLGYILTLGDHCQGYVFPVTAVSRYVYHHAQNVSALC